MESGVGMTELPERARVVVVGGGIVGCSVAYHLARRGCSDVLVLGRDRLTSGTTWHAAGLVGQLRATRNLTRLAQYTTELFATLEADTGQATGFVQRGSIAVARTAARFEELRRAPPLTTPASVPDGPSHRPLRVMGGPVRAGAHSRPTR